MKDLVFFDVETTGLDPATARIVQIGAVAYNAETLKRRYFNVYVNPGIPIPPEATAVHHITDEDARPCPPFAEVAPKFLTFLGDSDLGGFNILRYDIPVLVAEFNRAGLTFPLEGRRVVDALVIFHKMEPRDLTGAVSFYFGHGFPGAHDAADDAVASLHVFLNQRTRYTGRIPDNLDGLAAWCQAEAPTDKFRRREDGAAVFTFSKFKGRPLREVAETDDGRGFLQWMLKADFSTSVKDLVRKALAGESV